MAFKAIAGTIDQGGGICWRVQDNNNYYIVRMNPLECATVIMKFDLPTMLFVVPQSPRTGGYEYVWHCHILEHEDNEMMRPYDVVG